MPVVVNKQPRRVCFGDTVKLMPGANDVPAKAWDAVKDTAAAKHYLSEGLLEVVPSSPLKAVPPAGGATGEGGEGGTGEGDAVEDLKALKVPEAIKLVKETTDLPLLKRWADADDRKGVHAAIEDQIAELEDTGEGGEGEDEK